MKFEAKHQGKWVAAKNDKVIAGSTSLNKLIKKLENKEDLANIRFSLVPRGFID